MKKSLLFLLAVASSLSLYVWARPDPDEEGVKAAVADYVQGTRG